MAIYENITELIGNTPIVKLNRLVPEGAADVYVKLEAFNPGSSVKDRIALSMIEKAEADGLIKPAFSKTVPISLVLDPVGILTVTYLVFFASTGCSADAT